MITVESKTKRYRAVLREIDEGVEVAIYDRGPYSKNMGKLIKRDILDCPFHVALDAISDLVNSLTRDST